jgi:hypothetical protein
MTHFIKGVIVSVFFTVGYIMSTDKPFPYLDLVYIGQILMMGAAYILGTNWDTKKPAKAKDPTGTRGIMSNGKYPKILLFGSLPWHKTIKTKK